MHFGDREDPLTRRYSEKASDSSIFLSLEEIITFPS